MEVSKNPAKARPLSKNVKRLMWLERASPKNENVLSAHKRDTDSDHIYCHKQGTLFMEAAVMGINMTEFSEMFMNSQIAGIFDCDFSHSNDINKLSEFMRIPLLLKNPKAIVEALYWIDDIIKNITDTENKSLAITKAFEAERLKLPDKLQHRTENRNVEDLQYAYWLGYIYRYECILHEESSRMVYSAFGEQIMKEAYERLLKSPLANKNLSDIAEQICEALDRVLVEKYRKEEK